MPLSLGPFDTDPALLPLAGAQRYFDGAALNFLARAVLTISPVMTRGFRFSLECYQVATVFITVAAGGGSNVRFELGFYDLDDATLLISSLLSAAVVPGTTVALDFGTGAPSLYRGRVFRLIDLAAARVAGGGADPVVTARLYART